MITIPELKIESCSECPYLRYDQKSKYFCDRFHGKVIITEHQLEKECFKKGYKGIQIPQWCPFTNKLHGVVENV